MWIFFLLFLVLVVFFFSKWARKIRKDEIKINYKESFKEKKTSQKKENTINITSLNDFPKPKADNQDFGSIRK